MGRALVIKGADFLESAVALVNANLPYDSKIEYLQGDGTAFIDTGIVPTQDTRFNIDINIANPVENVGIIGSRTDTAVANVVVYYGKSATASENSWYFRYGATYDNSQRHYGVTGDFNVSNVAQPNVLDVVGAAEQSITAPTATFVGQRNMYLFGWNNGSITPNQIGGTVSLKIKRCKLYQGDAIVRDYIPVRVGQIGYLYDTVSKVLFGNAAETGAFVLGPDD